MIETFQINEDEFIHLMDMSETCQHALKIQFHKGNIFIMVDVTAHVDPYLKELAGLRECQESSPCSDTDATIQSVSISIS